jgi:DNA-binding transcriptional MerR regulator
LGESNLQVAHHHPVFTISVVAHLLGLHQQTIRQYEREGLVCPCRTVRKTRLYSQADIERLESINYLVRHCRVNLAGVKIMVRLSNAHPEIEVLLKNRGFVPQNESSPRLSHSQRKGSHEHTHPTEEP